MLLTRRLPWAIHAVMPDPTAVTVRKPHDRVRLEEFEVAPQPSQSCTPQTADWARWSTISSEAPRTYVPFFSEQGVCHGGAGESLPEVCSVLIILGTDRVPVLFTAT